MDRLSRILAAVTEPVDLEAIKGVVEELTGQIFEPGDDWREALFDHLVTNEYVYQTTQILKHPKRLSEAAWQTSQRVAMSRLAEGERASAELLAYLILGAAARKGGESLLRPKVHFFLRGLDEMVVALDGTEADPKLHLFLSLHDAKERFGGRHDDAFLPVLTCRSCGQHFFETHFLDLEFACGAKNRLRGFENGNAAQDAAGQDNAWWSPTPAGDRHPAGADQPAPGGGRRRPHGPQLEVASGLVLPPVRGDAPGPRRTAAWPTAAATRSRSCR